MVDDTPLLSSGDGDAKGHRICGCCCDSRRGTIIVSTISFVLTAIYMIMLAVGYNDPNWEEKVADQRTIDYINKNYLPAMILSGVSLAINLGVIFGASIYSVCLVAIGLLWTLAMLILDIVVGVNGYGTPGGIAWSIIWAIIWMYPQAVFVSEVRSGVMTPQTYPREKHSYCCNV